MLHYNKSILCFVLCVTLHTFLFSAQILTQGDYSSICNRPEYQELDRAFGRQKLIQALGTYQTENDNYNYYSRSLDFQCWSNIADKVIGMLLVEEKRRLFLVNVNLHLENHRKGLQALAACFDGARPDQSYQPIDTPHGPVYMQIHDNQYQEAMKVSTSIRNAMFGEGGNKRNPLVLVDKVDSRMSIALKWALFKGAVILAAIISSTRNENKDEKNKDRKTNENIGKALESAWQIADLSRALEEYAKNDLETTYPILKTHEVKSFIDEEIWWLYDRKNWIMIGSATAMILLLAALMHDKLPYLYRQYSVIIIT